MRISDWSSDVCSSDPDAPLLVSAGLLRPSVDLEVVGQTLYFSQLPRVETAIAGIKQLLPGHMLTWDGQREEISQHWNPWSHVETDFSKSTAKRSEMGRASWRERVCQYV